MGSGLSRRGFITGSLAGSATVALVGDVRRGGDVKRFTTGRLHASTWWSSKRGATGRRRSSSRPRASRGDIGTRAGECDPCAAAPGPSSTTKTGTCRMGADPDRSVVDPHGRVWGWSNLRVADASVFPSSLGANPQVTTMAMGMMVGEAIARGETPGWVPDPPRTCPQR